jgi:NADH-quinone oxidoreductase subunit J
VLIAALRHTEKNMTELGTGDIGLIQNLGKVLFNEYVVPFEISSILFLSAMVGAVVIGKRDETRVADSPVEQESRKMHEARETMGIDDLV